MTGFTYAEVGRTRDPVFLPDGYKHLRHSTLIGHGRHAFRAAGDAVITFRMHEGIGVGVRADTERAQPGARVDIALPIGPARIIAPCQVVWSVDEPARIGFAYGTLHGHPECGEESFVVELSEADDVWLTITAFSRPGRWFTRLAGPLVPVLQHAYARRCGSALREIVRSSETA